MHIDTSDTSKSNSSEDVSLNSSNPSSVISHSVPHSPSHSSKKTSHRKLPPTPPSLKFIVSVVVVACLMVVIGSNSNVTQAFSSFAERSSLQLTKMVGDVIDPQTYQVAFNEMASVSEAVNSALATSLSNTSNASSSVSCATSVDVTTVQQQEKDAQATLPALSLSETSIDAQIANVQQQIVQTTEQIAQVKAQLVGDDVVVGARKQITSLTQQIVDLQNIQTLKQSQQALQAKIANEEQTLGLMPDKQSTLKKTIDSLLTQIEQRKKVDGLLQAYVDAKNQSANFSKQLADRKALDNQGLVVYQAKLKLQSADSSQPIYSTYLNSYNIALQTYNTLYSAYNTTYNDTSTYLELVSSQDKVNTDLSDANKAYTDALSTYTSAYGKDTRTVGDLLTVEIKTQDTYDTQATLFNTLKSAHDADVSELAVQTQTLNVDIATYTSTYYPDGTKQANLVDLQTELKSLQDSVESLAQGQSNVNGQISSLTSVLNKYTETQQALVAQKSDIQNQIDAVGTQLNTLNHTLDGYLKNLCQN
jgi:chromosome segregation ATPase